MEQDPNLDPKTGKKKDRRKDDKPKQPTFDIKIDFEKIGFTSEGVNRTAEAMRKAIKAGRIHSFEEYRYMFGSGPRASGGGNVFIEGGDGIFHSFYDRLAANTVNMIGEGVDFKSAVSRMLHSKAIECWDNLLNWQFAVTYQDGQDKYWFTARYYDDEEASPVPLVSETLEFSGEVLIEQNWDETNLEVERQMEQLHEKCVADLAAFE
jgi:hypothetical protein